MGKEAHGSTLATNRIYAYAYACTRDIHSIPTLAFLPGKSLNSILYDAWANCVGDWTRSRFYQNIRERHTSTKRGVRKWLTESEMDDRFGVQLATAMRNRKLFDEELSKKEVREHPEVPGQQACVYVQFTSTVLPFQLVLPCLKYLNAISAGVSIPDPRGGFRGREI